MAKLVRQLFPTLLKFLVNEMPENNPNPKKMRHPSHVAGAFQPPPGYNENHERDSRLLFHAIRRL